jgi:hypothetical protein
MNMRKSEGGNGVGHSQMAHWQKTAEVKADAKRIRRHNDKIAIREGRD